MIERVARRLAQIRYAHCGEDRENLVPGKENWEFCVYDARAALAVIRTPTEAMLDAALNANLDIEWGYIEDGAHGRPSDVWRVMIDAALK